MLDYEPQDGRTNTVAHVKKEAAIARHFGHPLSVYTNPLDGRTTVYNDWTAKTVPQVLADPNIKYFSILIVPPRTGDDPASDRLVRSFRNQLSIMNGGSLPSRDAAFLSKVFVTFQIGSSKATWPTIAHTRDIHDEIVRWRIPAVNVFPKGADFKGQACPVPARDIAILATLLGLQLPCPIPAGY